MHPTAFARIKYGTAQIVPESSLMQALEQNKKLVVKLGMDPTAPDLHLGHTIVLKKLKQFQELGHTVIFLIGDFTARIGDPTGRSKTRQPLSEEQIAHNMRTYFEQVGKVMYLEKILIRYNSEWLQILNGADIVHLLSKVTLARITERDDFQKRIATQEAIGLHELLYPLLVAYDSVALHADVELGGTDQTFNLLMGRHLQEQMGQKPQIVITTPLLEGIDGVQKMSKSLGNAIGIAEPAEQAYGKLMSISDSLMWRYYELLLERETQEIEMLKHAVTLGTQHPMELKKRMAHGIISLFWSRQEADVAQDQFIALFEKKDYTYATPVAIPAGTPNPLWVVELLKLIGAISSSSEAKRLIESGAVLIDGITVVAFKAEIPWRLGMHIKVGKHRIYTLV
jgi:tyrosyl-tRNA synthetase